MHPLNQKQHFPALVVPDIDNAEVAGNDPLIFKKVREIDDDHFSTPDDPQNKYNSELPLENKWTLLHLHQGNGITPAIVYHWDQSCSAVQLS